MNQRDLQLDEEENYSQNFDEEYDQQDYGLEGSYPEDKMDFDNE